MIRASGPTLYLLSKALYSLKKKKFSLAILGLKMALKIGPAHQLAPMGLTQAHTALDAHLESHTHGLWNTPHKQTSAHNGATCTCTWQFITCVMQLHLIV